ncbi:YibE/F family protein [Longispora sp. NPDC051575]|uniref:YibE/F family protein n=1 Tax=Longispora sp. NPDC051575 TaxID=3154943 RepID=UPI0034228E95
MSSHPHQHGPLGANQRGTWRATLAVIVPAALIILAALIWLWPPSHTTADQPDGAQRVNGTITAINHEPCQQLPPGEQPPGARPGVNGCGTVTVRLTEGAASGTQVTVRMPNGPGAPTIAEGDDMVLMHLPDTPSGETYQIHDHQRGNQLWILGAAFALAVVAFGRWRGLSALAGLAVTFGVLLLFVVPAILAGQPPLLVAIVGAASIMLVVLYLTHGLSVSTSVAVAGTLASLTLTGVLSTVAVKTTHLSGVADETSSYLGLVHNVNMQGLLLAGILIGSLGVLDDVTVTQAATVTELARANPGYGFRQLYRSATRVGRSHIASVINTIILAYAGASLPLLVLIAAGNQPLGQVLTNQLIAQELVRSAVGTLGLIAAVPITTALAAFAARRSATMSPATPNLEHDPAPAPQERPAGDPADHLAVLSRERTAGPEQW